MAKARLRWKIKGRTCGGSKLWDGDWKYADTVYSPGIGRFAYRRGWYWTAKVKNERKRQDVDPHPTEAEAKAEAVAWVKARLEAQ